MGKKGVRHIKEENLLGQIFGRLTVIEELRQTNPRYKLPSWKCICSCANKTIVIIARGITLRSGHTKSCGCLLREECSKRASQRNFDNREFEPRIAVARQIFFRSYNDGSLVFDEFYALSQLNCHYCNIEPSTINDSPPDDASQYFINNCKFTYNGLDRVNNGLPHDTTNCVPCCKECNLSKRNMHIDDFYRMIFNIATRPARVIPNYIDLFSTSSNNFSRFKNIRGQMNQSYTDIDFDTFGYDLFCFIITQNCFYCNRESSNIRKDWKNNIILCNGLDRIDQKLPHTIDNIISCCKYCNWSKAKRSYAEFLSWAIRAHNHLLNNRNYLAANNLQSAV